MEEPRNRLSRSVVKLWLIVGVLGALLATAILVVVSVIFDLEPWIAIAGAVAAFAGAAIVPPLRYRRWRYEIRADDLYFS